MTSLKDRTKKTRADQNTRREEARKPKLPKDVYACRLMGSNFGLNRKKTAERFQLKFKVLSGKDTGSEHKKREFNLHISPSQDWQIDWLLILCEDLGVSLDWLDTQKDLNEAFMEVLEEMDGQKGFNIYCQESTKDANQNNYYFNEIDDELKGSLASHEDFGIDNFKAPAEAEAEEEEEEKKPAKKKKKAKKPEPEPEETPAEDPEEEWEDDWDED